MDDDELTRLADIVSERVFASMAKLLDVVENLVRDNETLRAKVARLELEVHEDDSGDVGFDCELVVPIYADGMEGYFDVDESEEPEDDDSEPTFD
jgi:16S rRNA G527 N7-methylase RsmG